MPVYSAVLIQLVTRDSEGLEEYAGGIWADSIHRRMPTRHTWANSIHEGTVRRSSVISKISLARQSVSLQLVVEGAAANTEDRCCFLLISGDRREGESDKFLFCRSERHTDVDRKVF